MSASWELAPGDKIKRSVLQKRLGGSPQGGIGPSRQSPNVFVFSDPSAGEAHGYFDEWQDDGCFHYTGEGQRGDQVMKAGNAAILRHVEDGRALRVFMGARGTVEYEDEFELDRDEPWYPTDAPETEDGPIRKVIVFRLRPKTIAPKKGKSKIALPKGPEVEIVPVEEQWTEKAFVEPGRKPYEAERREQKLVLAYQAHLETQGHTVGRLKLRPPGEAKPLFTDLYDETEDRMIEAKGSVTREAIRMAIGQLLDYRRLAEGEPGMALLVPEEPRANLRTLLASLQIDVIWPSNGGFEDTAA